MSNASIKSILQSRIQTAQQTSELEMGDTVYQSLFASPASSVGNSCDIPISKLRAFFTADIGFKPYPSAKLKALAEHMATDGQLERIIVRPIPGRDEYEILAGHNRTAAGKLNGWATMAAEVIEADDNRATSIAVSTNLLRRQDLTIFEKGQAYKALLDAKNRNGQRNAVKETFGESRQRYNARAIVAEFFGVSEYEIRKAIKLTQLIPELQEIIEEYPKLLNLSCAEKIADYDANVQRCFYEMCTVEGYSGFAIASRKIANRSQRYFFAHRNDLNREGARLKCRMLAVGPRRCLVECFGHDLALTQRDLRYTAIPDLRVEYYPGMELDCIVKSYAPESEQLVISVKETEVNPFFGAQQRHPVGARRLAIIAGKYGGGVFCNLPDGVTCMCNYSYQHDDADFIVGEQVMLLVQRYDTEKQQMYGKIMSKR